MTKLFFATVFCLTIVCSSANAQDVYAASNDGFDYYVVSETVACKEYGKTIYGKIHHITEVTASVKKIRGSNLVAVESWRFVSVDHHRWQYFINGKGRGAFNTVKDVYAMEILSAINTKHWKWQPRR